MKDLETKFIGHLPAESDRVAASRKRDHIEMAFQSQVDAGTLDSRFFYEPLLASHPDESTDISVNFLGKKMAAPLWVSSMTGGTKEAYVINHNLARACREYGLGMGLGSCRALLYSDERLADFDLRESIGPDQPLYANLGVAQLEELIRNKALDRIDALIHSLRADGIIIHVNPMQEWLQPEGDRLQGAPLDSIMHLLENTTARIIVKEVGQGMGPASIKALMGLPIAALDLGASGGTNFALLEILRKAKTEQQSFEGLAKVGHSALEMISFINALSPAEIKCQEVIISGGVKNFLDGYHLRNKLGLNSIYGQASAFLKHARGDYDILSQYVGAQIEGYKLASKFLQVR